MQQLRELELKQQLSIANESSESFDQVPPLTQTSMYYSGNLNPENLKTGLMFFCTVGMVTTLDKPNLCCQQAARLPVKTSTGVDGRERLR